MLPPFCLVQGGGMKVFFVTVLLLSDGHFANEQDLAVFR